MGVLRFQRPLLFDVGDVKLGDLTKLWFFKLIMTKSNLKKSFKNITVAFKNIAVAD